MLELKSEELMNIQGGGRGWYYYYRRGLPNFDAYAQIFSWIYKTIRSWF